MRSSRQRVKDLSLARDALSRSLRRMEIFWRRQKERRMSFRVISGKARGRKLKTVEGETTRPITDRVKESLFNIISGDVVDSNWWDMFGRHRRGGH